MEDMPVFVAMGRPGVTEFRLKQLHRLPDQPTAKTMPDDQYAFPEKMHRVVDIPFDHRYQPGSPVVHFQFHGDHGLEQAAEFKRLAIDRLEIGTVDNQRAQFVAENGILLSQIEKQSVELSRYTGKSAKITLPRSLNGKITAVDAQFDFVVLDIGENQGAREHGELLVSRGEKLIGKLRILDVKKDHSIANILPDWKQEEVQTGDLVIVGN